MIGESSPNGLISVYIVKYSKLHGDVGVNSQNKSDFQVVSAVSRAKWTAWEDVGVPHNSHMYYVYI